MLLALLLAGGLGGSLSGGPSAAITTQPSALAPTSVSPPPDNPAAAADCTKLLSALPVRLQDLAQRRVVSSSPYVVAWGDPAIVLRCGVPRPRMLTPGSSEVLYPITGSTGTVGWAPVNEAKQNIFTTVDRSVYIEVTVPVAYPQPPLAPLSDAIASVLPAVCQVAQFGKPAPPTASLCTHRP